MPSNAAKLNMKNIITTIAFDADDTLWGNESYFQEAEKEFCQLLANYLPQKSAAEELFKTEMNNLQLYGYGAKAFMLSMIETASRVSERTVSSELVAKIIRIGKELLQMPIELLPGVKETLEQLDGKYNLVLATKGDLLDQERKLIKSGLADFFQHIEVMSDKKAGNYQNLLNRLECKSANFLMLGNSIKSDILPVLALGGNGGYIPYYVTWAHEQHEDQIQHENFIQLKTIDEVLQYLS